MIDSKIPIVLDFPDKKRITILLSSDMHVGNPCFNEKRWNAFETLLDDPDTYVIFAGDAFEMALPRSRSSVFEQVLPPREQKRWWIEHMRPYAQKVLCLRDGNHERRAARETDSYPLYDVALALGIEERYRSTGAFVDIGVGSDKHNRKGKPFRYVIRVNHQAKNLKDFGTVHSFEGIDVFVSGHIHTPKDLPKGKIVYDAEHHTVRHRNVENMVCGSFLFYGGYGEDAGYAVPSEKQYSLILDGTKKNIVTPGFYLNY